MFDIKEQEANTPNTRISRILEELKYAKSKWKKLYDKVEEDFEFALGKQWEDEDVDTLDKIGVKALTLNKIQPLIFLISGIERQNRSDIVCYPEGKEDSLEAQISTALVQNSLKVSNFDYKISEQFEDGIIGGFGYLEPYIDYTNDVLNGELKWSKLTPTYVYPDPNFREYDLSDARFVYKVTPRLTKDDLITLYPDKKSVIENIKDGRLIVDLGSSPTLQKDDDYGSSSLPAEEDDTVETYDLVERYYKKLAPRYIVADKTTGKMVEIEDKDKAQEYAAKYNLADGTTSVVIKERMVPEIWCTAIVGNVEIDDSRAWSYPKWNGYPIIPFFAHRITTPIKDRSYMIQGVVRSLKDPQTEYNKRRTQILRIINSTANSGWKTPKGAWADKDAVEQFGSSPGVILEYKPEIGEPEQIRPPTIPAAHEQAAQENSQDIKEISGINSDLLAMSETQASGRAMQVRMKQGLAMLQRLFDNHKQTKMLAGKFVLSRLGDLYTIETARQVLGEDMIKELFSQPVTEQRMNAATGQVEEMPIDDGKGGIVEEINEEAVNAIVNYVLNDVDSKKYNITVGEGADSINMRESNYMELVDLAKQGVPIPPESIIEESFLPEQSKKRILEAIAQQKAAMMPPKPPTGMPGGDPA